MSGENDLRDPAAAAGGPGTFIPPHRLGPNLTTDPQIFPTSPPKWTRERAPLLPGLGHPMYARRRRASETSLFFDFQPTTLTRGLLPLVTRGLFPDKVNGILSREPGRRERGRRWMWYGDGRGRGTGDGGGGYQALSRSAGSARSSEGGA